MRRICGLLLLPLCMLICCSCSIERTDAKKLREVEFTVVNPDDVPEELASQIDKAGANPFKITFGDKGYLYIARGYGTKDTSGYSVEVPECFETANAIYMKTNLLGPAKDEEILKKQTCPYVVIKIEYSDKNVVFD